MTMNRSGWTRPLALTTITAIAVGAGCDAAPAPAPERGAVEVTVDLTEARSAVSYSADSYEVAIRVTDAAGREVGRTVVLSGLRARELAATLPCVRGATNVARAELIGAYDGRPFEPLAGAGGLALGEGWAKEAELLCPAEGTTRIGLGSENVQPMTPSTLGFVDFALMVPLPAALADREVATTWRLQMINTAGETVWQQFVSSEIYGGEGSLSYVGPCDPTPGQEVHTLTAWPVAVALDGERLSRDQWALDAVAEAFLCIDAQDNFLGVERPLTVDAAALVGTP